MYPEAIEFSEDMPVKACVRCVRQYPYHWHKALEIIVVLEGSAYIDIGADVRLLKADNVAVISAERLHRIRKSDEDNKLLILQIEWDFFTRIDPCFQYSFFYCFPYGTEILPGKKATLKSHIGSLVCLLDEEPDENHTAEVIKRLEEMLVYMIDSFEFLRFGPRITSRMKKGSE